MLCPTIVDGECNLFFQYIDRIQILLSSIPFIVFLFIVWLRLLNVSVCHANSVHLRVRNYIV